MAKFWDSFQPPDHQETLMEKYCCEDKLHRLSDTDRGPGTWPPRPAGRSSRSWRGPWCSRPCRHWRWRTTSEGGGGRTGAADLPGTEGTSAPTPQPLLNISSQFAVYVSALSPTWNDEIAALSVQGDLSKLSRPLCVKVVPGPVVYPHLRHSDLDVTGAQVEVKVEMAGEQLQTKEMSALEVL